MLEMLLCLWFYFLSIGGFYKRSFSCSVETYGGFCLLGYVNKTDMLVVLQ